MVGVHAGHELVVVAVSVQPCVVVAVLGPGSEGALWLVPPRYALTGEVTHPEAFAQGFDGGVVAFVQQPEVQHPAVSQCDRSFQGGPHHLHGFLARHEGGDERDLGVLLRHHRDRVARDQGGVRVRGHIDQPEKLQQADGGKHDHVQGPHPARGVLPVRPVGRLHQPGQQHRGEHWRRAEQQRGTDTVRFVGEQAAVPDAVGAVGGRSGERAGQSAVVLVVVSGRRYEARRPAWRAARRALRLLRNDGRAGVMGGVLPGAGLPGAGRCRRHGNAPPEAWVPRSTAVVSPGSCGPPPPG